MKAASSAGCSKYLRIGLVALGAAMFGYSMSFPTSAADNGNGLAPAQGAHQALSPAKKSELGSRASLGAAPMDKPAPHRETQAAAPQFEARPGMSAVAAPAGGGSKDTSDDYQLDDGSGDIDIGTAAGGVNILWFTRYTVLPGRSIIRTVNVAWGGTVPPGSMARVGLYSDPNQDTTPTDSVALANLLVVTSDEGTDTVNKYNIPDVVIGPVGTNFFTWAHRGLTVAGEYPARGDSTAPVPTNRCWIAFSAPTSPPNGAVLIESIAGLANKWMIRANAPGCPDGTCDPLEVCECVPDCGPPPIGTLESSHGPLSCQDGIDNDCDLLLDCDDPDCDGAFPETGNCDDGENNDCDCFVDCADSDCAGIGTCAPCALGACPGGAAIENEPDCSPGYNDVFNGGCNMGAAPVWSPIAAPAIGGPPVLVCGELGRYLGPCRVGCLYNDDCPFPETCNPATGMCSGGSSPFGGCPAGQTCSPGPGTCSGGACTTDCDCLPSQTCVAGACTAGQLPRRDTDWWQFTTTDERYVTICATSEVEIRIGIVDDGGGPNCPAATFLSNAIGSGGPAAACVEVCADPVCLPAGTYTAYAAPSGNTAFGNVPCGTTNYTMSLSAAKCGPFSACNIEAANQCQLPNQTGNPKIAATSDANPGADFRVADNFTASSAGSLQEVCWWGTYVDFGGGGAAVCAAPPADDFTITYYNNNGGSVPGTLKCGPFNIAPVNLDVVATGLIIPSGAGDFDEFSYTATHPACPIAAGECVWVEVQNNTPAVQPGGQECFWLWSTAPPGDGLSVQHAGRLPYVLGNDEQNFDLAWCGAAAVAPDGCQLEGVCGAGAPSGNACNMAAGTPGCTDAACCNTVCACDPFCCNVAWDVACVGPNGAVPGCSALDLCGACPVDPTNNDPACWDTDSNGVRDARCIWWDCTAGACTSVTLSALDAGGAFGVCPPDGFCNIHDRTHALTCFAGTNPCSDFAADLGGAFGVCPNDGFCNIHDATHVLRCFAGTNSCVCHGPSPAPESDPVVVEAAHLTASATKKAVRAGDEVQVRVYINEALADLQGYQLHLDSNGGRRGSLDLVDISIEPALKGVFGRSANYEAYNITRGQMLNGREDGGVATHAKGYLATYTYRASAGCCRHVRGGRAAR